ncbi:MAG: DUF2061 domain-containing protein [archaeon]
MDNHLRSITKGVSYRVFGTAATVAISYAVTRDYTISGIIGGADLVAKIFIYYAHERVWENISFGRKNLKSRLEEIKNG